MPTLAFKISHLPPTPMHSPPPHPPHTHTQMLYNTDNNNYLLTDCVAEGSSRPPITPAASINGKITNNVLHEKCEKAAMSMFASHSQARKYSNSYSTSLVDSGQSLQKKVTVHKHWWREIGYNQMRPLSEYPGTEPNSSYSNYLTDSNHAFHQSCCLLLCRICFP